MLSLEKLSTDDGFDEVVASANHLTASPWSSGVLVNLVHWIHLSQFFPRASVPSAFLRLGAKFIHGLATGVPRAFPGRMVRHQPSPGISGPWDCTN